MVKLNFFIKLFILFFFLLIHDLNGKPLNSKNIEYQIGYTNNTNFQGNSFIKIRLIDSPFDIKGKITCSLLTFDSRNIFSYTSKKRPALKNSINFSCTHNETSTFYIPFYMYNSCKGVKIEIFNDTELIFEHEVTPTYNRYFVYGVLGNDLNFYQFIRSLSNSENYNYLKFIYFNPDELNNPYFIYGPMLGVIIDYIELDKLNTVQIDNLRKYLYYGGTLYFTVNGLLKNLNHPLVREIFGELNISGIIKKEPDDFFKNYFKLDKSSSIIADFIKFTKPNKHAYIFEKKINPLFLKSETGFGKSLACCFDLMDITTSSKVTYTITTEKIWSASIGLIHKYFNNYDIYIPKNYLTRNIIGYAIIGAVIFIIVFGPLQVFILMKIDKKEWILITTIISACLFTILFIYIAKSLRPGQITVEQHEIYYSDNNNYTLKHIADGILSPDKITADFKFPGNYPVNEKVLTTRSWQMLENDMDKVPVEYLYKHNAVHIKNVRLKNWSCRFFNSRQVCDTKITFSSELYAGTDSISGYITNKSPFNFDTAILLLGPDKKKIGNIRSGETKKISIQLSKDIFKDIPVQIECRTGHCGVPLTKELSKKEKEMLYFYYQTCSRSLPANNLYLIGRTRIPSAGLQVPGKEYKTVINQTGVIKLDYRFNTDFTVYPSMCELKYLDYNGMWSNYNTSHKNSYEIKCYLPLKDKINCRNLKLMMKTNKYSLAIISSFSIYLYDFISHKYMPPAKFKTEENITYDISEADRYISPFDNVIQVKIEANNKTGHPIYFSLNKFAICCEGTKNDKN